MARRDLMRIYNPRRRKPATCPECGSTTYVTKDGHWFKHRMPPMNLGYGMPNYAGPICKASGHAKSSAELPPDSYAS